MPQRLRTFAPLLMAILLFSPKVQSQEPVSATLLIGTGAALVGVAASIAVVEVTCHQRSIPQGVEIARGFLSDQLKRARMNVALFSTVVAAQVKRTLEETPPEESACEIREFYSDEKRGQITDMGAFYEAIAEFANNGCQDDDPNFVDNEGPLRQYRAQGALRTWVRQMKDSGKGDNFNLLTKEEKIRSRFEWLRTNVKRAAQSMGWTYNPCWEKFYPGMNNKDESPPVGPQVRPQF